MKKILVVIVLLVVVLYGAVRWGFIRFPGNDGSDAALRSSEQLSQLKTITQKKVPGSVPDVSGEKGVPFASLPEKVQSLILSGDDVVAATEVTLADGQKGYRIQYSTERNLISEYLDFIDNFYNLGPAATNQSSRVDNAAFAFLENDYWRVAAEFTGAPYDTTAVTVTVTLK